MKFKFLFVFGLVIGAVFADSVDTWEAPDVDGVKTLRIEAASGNSESHIYANGINLLEVNIFVEAVYENKTVSNITDEDWINFLEIRFAEDDTALDWNCLKNGSWCYTQYKNDYAVEIPRDSQSTISKTASGTPKNDTELKKITMYVYTNQTGTRRLAVSLDNQDGIYFTTADNAIGAEKSSVRVVAHNPIKYTTEDLKIDVTFGNGRTKNNVTGCKNGQYDVDYDSYYISAPRIPGGIRNADFSSYDGGDGNESVSQWISSYDSFGNDQHMVVVHPFAVDNEAAKNDEFGIKNKGDCKGCQCNYDLTQRVYYNQRSNQISLTKMTFHTKDAWYLDDGASMETEEFYFETLLYVYDMYGNSGEFSVGLSENNTKIEIKEIEKREDIDGVVELTNDTFNDHIANGNHFVAFYVSWGKHSKLLKPIWNELAKSLENDTSVSISQINCANHESICKDFDVHRYPRMVWVVDGKKVEQYPKSGKRSVEAFQNYIEKHTEKNENTE